MLQQNLIPLHDELLGYCVPTEITRKELHPIQVDLEAVGTVGLLALITNNEDVVWVDEPATDALLEEGRKGLCLTIVVLALNVRVVFKRVIAVLRQLEYSDLPYDLIEVEALPCLRLEELLCSMVTHATLQCLLGCIVEKTIKPPLIRIVILYTAYAHFLSTSELYAISQLVCLSY